MIKGFIFIIVCEPERDKIPYDRIEKSYTLLDCSKSSRQCSLFLAARARVAAGPPPHHPRRRRRAGIHDTLAGADPRGQSNGPRLATTT